MRGKKSKQILLAHFKHRLLQRYQLDANPRVLKKITEYIQSGRAQCLGKQSLTRSFFLIPSSEIPEIKEDLTVIYDKLRHSCVTVLPKSKEEI